MTEPESNTIEEWRPVVGFEEYYSVSNLGRIRRDKGGPGAVKGRILKQTITLAGYLVVGINPPPGMNKKRAPMLVHRIVAFAFIGIPSDGRIVNHKNGKKTDNREQNLEYVTYSENNLHAVSLGIFPTGSRNGSNTKPESRPRGDNHYSRTNPEKLARGDCHAARLRPEIMKRGTSHWKCKLTAEQVLAIQMSYGSGAFTQRELAAHYGVKQSHIWRIVHKKTRKQG